MGSLYRSSFKCTQVLFYTYRCIYFYLIVYIRTNILDVRPVSVETFMDTKCYTTSAKADISGSLLGEIRRSFMGYERSFITMKSNWHSYLVSSLSNYTIQLCIETGLSIFHVKTELASCFTVLAPPH